MTAVSDDVQPNGHEEVEDSFGIDLEIHDCADASGGAKCFALSVCVLSLNASPADRATIMITVKAHLSKYGSIGISGNSRTPCLDAEVRSRLDNS